MRKLKLFSLFLLLLIGVGQTWGTNYSFASSIPTGWSASSNPSSYETSNNGTSTFGRGACWATNFTLTLQNVSNVTEIVITYSANNAQTGFSVTVGGESWGGSTKALKKGDRNATKTFSDDAASGNVVISYTRTDKSVWIKSISITTSGSNNPTLSSISVNTAPTKTTYTEGETFNPAGLVITRTYSNSTTSTWAYNDHSSDFSFTPSTSTALTTSNTSVTISYGGKTVNQSITVNAFQATRGLDVLTNSLIGVSGTSYSDWSNKSYSSSGHSSAIYKGNSAGGNSSIQLRASNSSGIITTQTGGNATRVTVVWNSSTAADRTIDIYGKNSVYSSAGDLYSAQSATQGEKIGSITNGTTSVDLTGNYAYIGIRSRSNTLYLDAVKVTWGYTVTYNGNGNTSGSVPTDGTYYDNNATVTVKTNSGSLAKTGYDFGGWNTKANGSGTNRAASSTYNITSHDTLYAKWTPKQYTITYNDQGNVNFSGTHASGYPTTHTYGTATTLKTATKTGYDFGGWYTTQACTGSAVTTLGATAYTANITLYAKWTPKQYTITYKDKNNANFSGTHASGYPTKHTYGTATTLSTATKTGYDFGGWFTAAACTGSAVTSLGATAYTASPTVYALWTPVNYTITYEGLSGATNSNPGSYTIETATFNLADPGSRTGYTFAGWTCGGNPITQITLGSTGNKTITATWTPIQYSITYMDQGGSSFSGTHASGYPTTHTYGTATTLKTATKTGYTFGGWYTNSACTGDAVTSLGATTYTASPALYAKWTANTYYVRFNKNNDDAEGTMSNQEFTYDVSQELSKNTFSLANKNFKGWATEENGDVEYDDEAEVDNLTTANNGIVDLYAVWVANTHSVTYVANDKTGGTVPTDNTTYNHNATVTVLGGGDLAKTHYAFAGWTDGVNNYIEGSTFAITDDVTLSALWACDEVVTVAKAASTDHGSFTLDKSGELATCDAAVVVTVTPSANTGYEFSAITQTGLNSGVTINQNAKTVTYDQNTNGSSEINVTFAAKHITVTWNVNGGDDLDDETSEYVYDGSTVTMPTPTRTGYDFDGWYTEAEGGTKITEIGMTNKPSADVEYYAHWNVKSYSVTWMISGTEWTDDGQSSVNHGSHVTTLPTPPDPADYCGDKFMGWTTDAVFTLNTSPLYTSAGAFPNATGAQTFYAVFADYTK